jgi:hypothetical protein
MTIGTLLRIDGMEGTLDRQIRADKLIFNPCIPWSSNRTSIAITW